MTKLFQFAIICSLFQLMIYSAMPSVAGWWYAKAEAGYHTTRDKIYGEPK